MKPNAMLVVTSLLSLLLLTLHVTDDIVRGISKAEPSNIALLVLTVFLYGTLVLAERRSGHVIMLLVGLFAAAMPAMHMRGVHYGEIAKSTGGFFFVWTLWALGGLGGVTFILSARGAGEHPPVLHFWDAESCRRGLNAEEYHAIPMPESIDWPAMRQPRRRRFLLILILAIFAGVVLGGRMALSFCVDALWFGSLGYGDAF